MIIYYLLVFVIPLEHHPIWAGFIGGMTVIKYVGAVCFFYAMAHLALKSRLPDLLGTWSARWFLLYTLLVTLQCARVGRLNFQPGPFLPTFSFVVFFIITLSVVDSEQRLRWTLLAAMGAIALASLYTIRDWQKYHALYAAYRPSGAAGDPNYFALTAMFTIALGPYLAFERPSKLQKWYCLGCLAVTSIAVTLGASRGALPAMLSIFLMMALRSKKRMRYLLVLALFLAPSFFLDSSPAKRFFAPSERDTANTVTRTTVWRAGLRMVEQNPFMGVGIDNFSPLATAYEDTNEEGVRSMAHNTYIQLGAEMGLPGLVIFLMIYVSAFQMLERMRKRPRQAGTLTSRVALAIEAGFVGAAVCAFFLSAEYEKFPWFFLFLAMAMYHLPRRRRPRKERLMADVALVGASVAN